MKSQKKQMIYAILAPILLCVVIAFGIYITGDLPIPSDIQIPNKTTTDDTQTESNTQETKPYQATPVTIFDEYLVYDVNDNKPSFTKIQQKTTEPEIRYETSKDDRQAATVYACIGPEQIIEITTEPTTVPSGYIDIEYDGTKLYHKCYLLSDTLGGEDNASNVITGTTYFYEEALSKYNNMIWMYIRNTNNHVIYRATPNYNENEIIPHSVQIEAYSVEDEGYGLSLNIQIQNYAKNIITDYTTGDSHQLTSQTKE